MCRLQCAIVHVHVGARTLHMVALPSRAGVRIVTANLPKSFVNISLTIGQQKMYSVFIHCLQLDTIVCPSYTMSH